MRLYVLIVSVFFFFISCKNESVKKEVQRVAIEFRYEADISLLRYEEVITKIQLELAQTDYQKETGLMHRKSLQPNQGMLFVYENERPRPGFYMKNTHIALDLIYLNASFEVVDVFKNAEPFNETTIPSIAPAMYVLEVNAGFVDEFDVVLGNRFAFAKLK